MPRAMFTAYRLAGRQARLRVAAFRQCIKERL
jgi:hypothetical protein